LNKFTTGTFGESARRNYIETSSEAFMINCTNCGQINTETSYFCRFCGTKFSQQQPQPILDSESYEYAPPRPYSWKTDEFQVAENRKPRTQTTNQPQPLVNQFATQQSARPQPLVQQSPQNMAYGYRCPRCSNQQLPKVIKRISTAGWIVFAVLLLVFFPLFWIGLLIKEDVRLCSVCNYKIN